MSVVREMEFLLRRSREFFEGAEYHLSRGHYGLAAFCLEQSLQLFLKAKLLEAGVGYPRTHSVRRLVEMLADALPGEKGESLKEMATKYLLELSLLEDAYITARYFSREYTMEEVKALERAVREVLESV